MKAHYNKIITPVPSKHIRLKSVEDNMKSIYGFADKLIQSLENDFYTIESKTTLYYRILSQISPANKKLEENDASIEIACETILKYFGLPLNVSVKKYQNGAWVDKDNKQKTFTEEFFKVVLDINELPAPIYQTILSQVSTDLENICKLIKKYEAIPCIEKYIKKDEIPYSHQERIIYDFYKRCKNEKDLIVEYLMFGIKKRVRDKCRYSYRFFGAVIGSIFADRPYYYARPFSIHYFNYEKLDLVGHRIMDYSIGDNSGIEKLYYINKPLFYRKYFGKNSIQQHFKEILFYLPYLPLQKNRDVIFKELIRLFKTKRWISFYALALPQVEGLFSEMCTVVFPDADLSQRSLTHKVNLLRPHYYLSTSYFDYYQYHIPLQRNRFSHTGYDEDFKLKAFDLLVDILHIVKMFCEIDNPIVKIKRLHIRRNYEDFITLADVSNYLQMLKLIESNKKHNLSDEIIDFEKTFLNENCDLDTICNQVIEELPAKLQDLIVFINTSVERQIPKFDISNSNIIKVKEDLKIKGVARTWRFIFTNQREQFDLLNNCNTFLISHKKHLSSLEENVKKEFNTLFSKYGKTLKLINEIKAIVDNDEKQ